eukprot:3117844-Rhodomonas_salina.2
MAHTHSRTTAAACPNFSTSTATADTTPKSTVFLVRGILHARVLQLNHPRGIPMMSKPPACAAACCA